MGVKGATSKFTAARRAVILEALEKGLTLTAAAGLAGVTRQTVYNWLAEGEKRETGAYRDFYLAIAEANAKAEQVAVRAIRSAMPDDWRAAIAYLERRHPEEWTKRERHEVSGPAGEPIKVEVKWPGAPAS